VDKSIQPLTEIWDIYTHSLDQAIADGFLTDEEISDSYVWPHDLHLADWEEEDVKRYISDRMTEITERVKTRGGLDPNLVAGYLFRSIILGMLWHHERIGR